MPKPFAFVVMPFSPQFNDVYQLGIKPACEGAGYYCERLDEQIFQESMLDRIYNQIAKADLVVADLSERNANVFYETGYAHALGKLVILLTRDAADIPFDLKHHVHIVYSGGITELKKQLQARAAYYVKNPDTSSRDPLQQLTIVVNGKTVDPATSELSIEMPRGRAYTDGVVESYHEILVVEVVVHLPVDDLELQEVDVDVRLITPANYPLSGWSNAGESSQVYTTIPMLDGTMMHKPGGRLRVGANNPDKVRFELRRHLNERADRDRMTLRLRSGGLHRSVTLNVVDTPHIYERGSDVRFS